jgi:hypothetical protein
MSFWGKHMAEQFSIHRHSLFDPDIWSKIVKTDARHQFQRRARKLARRYLTKAVDEIVWASAHENRQTS